MDKSRLELFQTDGASSLCLAIQNPDGVLTTIVEGSKHTGKDRSLGKGKIPYVIHTYLMFKADKPRP